jgi:hypothetical protein
MSPRAIIREALRALFRNKMRSTALGPPADVDISQLT